MSTTLYIAEKPDIGRAIASYLWPTGKMQREKTHFTDGNTTVTWAFGHILKLYEPEDYDPSYHSWSTYPTYPDTWKYKPDANKKDHLKAVIALIRKADVVVHAGDPDREGQLLIDEILSYAQYTGPVKRLLINAKDDVSMKRAFDSIEDNSKYHSLSEAGLAREQTDWLIGMNLTRAYTVNSRKFGYQSAFRIGRVKIPTLALVVRRETKIQQFKSKKYYELAGNFTKDNITFKAKLVPPDTLPLDAEGRVLDEKVLQLILEKVRTATATVTNVETKDGKRQPPLPHSLDTLQVLANKKYDYSPQKVLDTVQALYEKKYVSYPRSDCNYIPASQHGDASNIITMLQHYGLPAAVMANPALTSKAWNDKKVTAHHAIIPTGVEPKDLSNEENAIYQLIATQYCLQFYPPYEFRKVTFFIQAADCQFKGIGTETLKKGYTSVFHDEEKDTKDENPVLPSLRTGDAVTAEYVINTKKTTPPKRFTEGTLLAAMTHIDRFVAPDNPNREKLKEIKGIGTPATRNEIIADLQATKLKGKPILPCMIKKSKELVPTEYGTLLVSIVDTTLTYPDATAAMEFTLSEIEHGTKDRISYLDTVIDMVNKNIQYVEKLTFPKLKSMPEPAHVPCPICQKTELARYYSQKLKKAFWVCPDKNCVSPITGNTMYYEDADNKPVIEFCPHCAGVPLLYLKGKFGFFWKCPKCQSTYSDKKGKPDLSPKKGKARAK